MSSVGRKRDRAVSRQQSLSVTFAVSSDVSEEEVKKTVMQIEMTASVAQD